MTVATSHRRSRTRRGALAVAVAAVAAAIAVTIFAIAPVSRADPWTCVSANDIPTVTKWSRVLDRQINCAVSFIDAAPNWRSWDNPWIIGYRSNWPKYDWVDWFDYGTRGRHLILTQTLIPSDLRGTNWLAAGAAGKFEPYARVLAENLVRAGMGSVVIRLGHEANGTWYADSIPDTPTGDAQWVRLWDNTVRAMRSVPGAHFRFDWTVNAGYRPITLPAFYPGNRYVDIVGVDAYDALPFPAPGNRLTAILDEQDGLRAVKAFARRHHKPMSIPEWGIDPSGASHGTPDYPAYVNAIARAANTGNVLYQSYFTGGVEGTTLLASPGGLAAYRRDFGNGS